MIKRTFLFVILCTFSALLIGEPQFQVTADGGRVYYTGRLSVPASERVEAPSVKYMLADGPFPKTLGRSISALSEVLDQGACGSCVYHGCSSAWMDTMILVGMPYERLSPRYVMECASRNWGCNGSIAQNYWTGVVAKGGAALERDYPYAPSQRQCQGSPQLHGKIVSFEIINNSPRSSIAAMNDRKALAVTIGAGGAFMNYRTGIFSQCSNVPTNHQVEVYDYDCETAVDGNGNCVFDSAGKLPNGVGFWYMRNSWGRGWGDQGLIKIKMTDSQGRRCNNIMEEVSVVDVGAPPPPPPPPPGPVSFDMESSAMHLRVSLASGSKVTPAQAKAIVQPFLDSLK